MRIFIDARSFIDTQRGGVSRVATKISTAYAKAYPNDEIICATTGIKKPKLPNCLASQPNVNHIHLKIANKLWSAGCMSGIASLPRSVARISKKIDVFFFPNIGFIGATSKMPTILLLHDLSFLIEPHWFTRKQRLWHHAIYTRHLITTAKQLLSVSETTKRDAIRILGIPEDRITVIPIGPTLTDTSNIRLDPHNKRSMAHPFTKKYILALGENNPRKNIAIAKAAVNALRADTHYADIKLIIPTGKPTDDQLASLYKNAAVFLYPSWYEGYGLPLHEAASFGTPCVASTSGALPETAPMGTFFADPAKPHHWVEALKLALTKPRTPVAPDLDGWRKAATTLHHAISTIKT